MGPPVDAVAPVLVPGGGFWMGNDHFYPEEAPVRWAEVGDVWFDPAPVTNREFAAFVEATGHVTVAEIAPDAFPGADPDLLVPGSQVFTPTLGPVDLGDWTQWWRWQAGASWRTPSGPGSSWLDVADHPVVHVGWEDAAAYARWGGKDLPTEAEWEHACRGGLECADYAWGDTLAPGGSVPANVWTGTFPWSRSSGRHLTSPVGAHAPNPFGLVDMIGNVWEWTRTCWTSSHREDATDTPLRSCCGGTLRLGESDRMVTKGGSHLCSPSYCRRYRPAARQGQGANDTTSHVGFRCVVRSLDHVRPEGWSAPH